MSQSPCLLLCRHRKLPLTLVHILANLTTVEEDD